MTNLITCVGCGKKYSKNAPKDTIELDCVGTVDGAGQKVSGKAPKCPNCGMKYFICRLCGVPIVPNERIHVVKHYKFRKNEGDFTYIHLSCLQPHFISPEHIKCHDCGQRINCPKFSLEDFIEGINTFKINCSNCGNPDVLGLNTVNYTKEYAECPRCQLLIIPAIHNIGRNYISDDDFGVIGKNYILSARAKL